MQMQIRMQMQEEKTCSCCGKQTQKDQIETYPLGFMAPNTFQPLSNQVFCSKPCVKRYLMSCETYLQTLYSLYVGGSVILPARDPLSHGSHIISSPIYPKKCILCFAETSNPHSYVLAKEKGLYKLADLAFCVAPCIRKWLKMNVEPYFFNLFEEYCAVVFDEHINRGIAHDPKRLQSRQIVAQADSMTLEQFHANYFYPCSGLPPDQYSTILITGNTTDVTSPAINPNLVSVVVKKE
jgi:hypothetical protein